MELLTPAFLAFVGLSALLTVTPGADMALVASKVVRHGERVAFVTTVGILLGLVAHALASAVGLSAILARSALAFEVVKWVGAGYLAYLGLRALWGSRAGAPEPAPAPPGAWARGAHRHFAHGFLSNLLNPKVALFYLLVVPQFIPAGAPVLAGSLLLASVHIGMGLVWLPLYAHGLARLTAGARSPRVRRWLERVTGGAMLALGARLAVQRGVAG